MEEGDYHTILYKRVREDCTPLFSAIGHQFNELCVNREKTIWFPVKEMYGIPPLTRVVWISTFTNQGTKPQPEGSAL
jgi:hypothetical protein